MITAIVGSRVVVVVLSDQIPGNILNIEQIGFAEDQI